MITPAEIALLKAADPQGIIPGINETVGNPLASSSLKPLSSLTTNSSAPVFYDRSSNRVVVKAAGTVLSGYNFGSAEVWIVANNVTVNDCTFSNPSSEYSSVRQVYGYSGMVVENSTFLGGDGSPSTTTVVASGYATVKNNTFLDTSGHTIEIDDGVVSGNDISGGGYGVGVHADAINVYETTGPVTISGNFVDWTNNSDALASATNNAIRITTDSGNTSNVTVTGNVVLGGQYTISAQPSKTIWLGDGSTGTLGSTGVMTNVNISGNYIGFAVGGPFYSTSVPGVVEFANTIFDYRNPAYSASAWAAYLARGVGTQYLVSSTGSNISGNSSGTTTLYGDGYHVGMSASGFHETVFVGGAGGQSMVGGPGANIFKYLSVGDSASEGGEDCINLFDPAKDVIDLGAINSNPAGISGYASSFTFIGTSAFTASGDQVRYAYDAASNTTDVEANLAGDASFGDTPPDLVIRLAGNVALTAANFALTPAQSAADLTAGAAMTVTKTYFAAGVSEAAYTNVQGRAYSSFDDIDASSGLIAEAFNNADGSGSLILSGANLTYSAGSSQSVGPTGGSAVKLMAHAIETIQAGASGSETFSFSQGFGAVTINGFANSGSAPDAIQLTKAAFSYLTAGMTQAQDLAAILAHGVNGTAGFTIQDSNHDTITLAGLTGAALAANPGVFHFV